MKPNLIIPGAPKSGTSSLHEYLNLHPQIEMSRIKEPHYFTINKRYGKGLNYYDDLFYSNNMKYYGESSTAYFSDRTSIERIKKDLSELKLIVILRNPIDRSISHYLWQVSLLQEFKSFRKAIRYNIKHPIDYRKLSWDGHFKNYYGSSLYGRNTQVLIHNFGKENLHVITTKELAENTKKCLNGCFEFLGLSNYDIEVKIKSNKTKQILSGSELTRNFIKKGIKKWVLDFRLLAQVINRKIGVVSKEDKLWLSELLEEDIRILNNNFPYIKERW